MKTISQIQTKQTSGKNSNRGTIAGLNLLGNSQPMNAAEAAHLLDLFRSGNNDIDRGAGFFASHPNLEAEVIKRSNSALYHREQRTTDVHDAVLRLGNFELYEIVFNALAKYQFTTGATN